MHWSLDDVDLWNLWLDAKEEAEFLSRPGRG